MMEPQLTGSIILWFHAHMRVAGLSRLAIRTFQSIVYPAQCDAMGHMNVQYYTASFDQAMWTLVYSLGWKPASAPIRTGFADVRHDLKFMSELEVGVPFCVDSIPFRAGRTSFVSRHRMLNLATGKLAAEMEMTSVHFDLEHRIAIPIPPALKEAAEAPWPWAPAESGDS